MVLKTVLRESLVPLREALVIYLEVKLRPFEGLVRLQLLFGIFDHPLFFQFDQNFRILVSRLVDLGHKTLGLNDF